MEFTQIAGLVYFAQTANLRAFWKNIKGIGEPKELIYQIRDYKVFPVLLEINDNYINHPKRKNELGEVYDRYLEEMDKAVMRYPEKEQEVFGWKIKAIKKQLELPIYLLPGLNRENVKKDISSNQNQLKGEIENEENHPKHDPNLWTIGAYELFKYLFDEYYLPKQTDKRLMDIFFYLKDKEYKNRDTLCLVHATKDEYFSFLNEHYKLFPTNKDRSNNYEKHKIMLEEHEEKYSNHLKK
ncbi:hypothetical protein VS868_03255 [Salinimicrobium sp. 3283s]|uniref:hypothetical protein n=1 Tax=Salinimicrobium sp. 3283s TaxID=3114359 RepID=UPI0031E8550F